MPTLIFFLFRVTKSWLLRIFVENVQKTVEDEPNMTLEEYQGEVERLRPVLCRLATRYLGAADGEDAVEVVLVRLWRMAGDLRAPVDALARTLLRNHCVDVLRRRHVTVPLDGHDIAAPGQAPAEADERLDTMMRLIRSLPPMQQTVLQLRHINGMEMSEVASLTGMKEPAVRKCLSRARQALRTLMLREASEE